MSRVPPPIDVETVTLKAVELASYAEGVIEIRVHSDSISGASTTAKVREILPPEDPSGDDCS